MKPIHIGDTVWTARSAKEPIKVTCPICYRKKIVSLILGNGDELELKCDFCSSGYAPPSGEVTEYKFVTDPTRRQITEIRTETTEKGTETIYMSDSYVLYEDIVFATFEAAEERSKIMAAEHQAHEDEQFLRRKSNGSRMSSYSYSAGYHMREARRHQETADRHREAAKICSSRIRPTKPKE